MPINAGAALGKNATLEDAIRVINELVGNYTLAEPVTHFATQSSLDAFWMLLSGFLVFWMSAGFSLLEAGSVRHRNAVNIMFKNLGDLVVGAICYYLTGYGLAYGTDNEGSPSYKFIGSGGYFISDKSQRAFWYFQFAFAATGATIVSGAVAGRVNLFGYFIVAAWLTCFVYPVVSHWIWATGGWASAFTPGPGPDTLFEDCGMIDFAGSGVVHMTGGTAAFWAALFIGPRHGRFPNGSSERIPPHNIGNCALGCFVLWFGWYGFNCGSTLVLDSELMAKVAVTTTLSPAAAGITSMVYTRRVRGYFDILTTINAILGGLVGITAGCSVVDDEASILIGAVSALVVIGASELLDRLRIDDPLDAVPVHGCCGIWGCLAVGIFATPENISRSYGGRVCAGNTNGVQFMSQLVGVFAIFGWVTVMSVPCFMVLERLQLFSVSSKVQAEGLDRVEHGGARAFRASISLPEGGELLRQLTAKKLLPEGTESAKKHTHKVRPSVLRDGSNRSQLYTTASTPENEEV